MSRDRSEAGLRWAIEILNGYLDDQFDVVAACLVGLDREVTWMLLFCLSLTWTG